MAQTRRREGSRLYSVRLIFRSPLRVEYNDRLTRREATINGQRRDGLTDIPELTK